MLSMCGPRSAGAVTFVITASRLADTGLAAIRAERNVCCSDYSFRCCNKPDWIRGR